MESGLHSTHADTPQSGIRLKTAAVIAVTIFSVASQKVVPWEVLCRQPRPSTTLWPLLTFLQHSHGNSDILWSRIGVWGRQPSPP
jgi:hypothetical protein